MQRVVLDACVLFPPLTRRLILDTAEAGLFAPRWSERILEEWRRAAAGKNGGDTAGPIAAMTHRWPDACLPEALDLEATLALPDPADAHVVAVAADRAETILTFNMRDFPARALAGLGLTARHPDGFLWELLSRAPGPVGQVLTTALADHDAADPSAGRRALKRARLSRLGKAWEAMRGAEGG
ncbi:MAG: PIN domain-containing protein [Pseudomonadota bacterium]